MIDTHAHIYSSEFDLDRNEVIQRAIEAGVTHIILANVDSESFPQLIQTWQTYPEICVPTLGLHPTNVQENYRDELAFLESQLDKYPYCAIGEIGLDLYWDKSFLAQQYDAFEIQMGWAAKKDLPVIIHIRDAFEEMHHALKQLAALPKRGIIHSFSGSVADVHKIKEAGNFLFGINGIVTFKKSTLPDVVKEIGLNHLVLETDAPYLAPTPHRGKRNEPALMLNTAQKIAEIFDCDIEYVIKCTSDNAEKMLNLQKK